MEGLIFGILRYCNFEVNTDEIRRATLSLWGRALRDVTKSCCVGELRLIANSKSVRHQNFSLHHLNVYNLTQLPM